EHFHVAEVDDELGELGEEARIAAARHGTHVHRAEHRFELANAVALHHMTVGGRSHADEALQGGDRQARIAARRRDDRESAWRENAADLAVEAADIGEVLVDIDHDDDIEGAVRIGKAVDVDVRHRIAEEFGHLGNPLRIYLTPAPVAAGGTEVIV